MQSFTAADRVGDKVESHIPRMFSRWIIDGELRGLIRIRRSTARRSRIFRQLACQMRQRLIPFVLSSTTLHESGTPIA